MDQKAPTADAIAAKLAEAGLKLPAGDIEKLLPMVAELEISARMIRKDRSYLEEPIQTLRLWAR